MTNEQWNIFKQFKFEFFEQCNLWNKFSSELIPLQNQVSKIDTPFYQIECPIVFNTSLNSITKDSEIKLIIIGDNPGKSEQLFVNQKYLVGQAGKIADSFFCHHPELQIDFKKNVIILNKTPIHSAKTKHLSKIDFLLKEQNSPAKNLLEKTQIWMAKKTATFHKEFSKANNLAPIELWLVGYSELKNKGIFIPYKDTLFEEYKNSSEWNNVFVYQHFSMNRFSIDLKTYQQQNKTNLKTALTKLGIQHKNEIFI